MGKARLLPLLTALGWILGNTACGDDVTEAPFTEADAGDAGNASPDGGSSFAIGGVVSGLEGAGLVIVNNGSDDTSIGADGTFAFPSKLAAGAAFDVKVKARPAAPTQTCEVAGGAGTVGAADVSGIAIRCRTDRFTVGGSVVGLDGNGLVLQNKAGDDLAVANSGTFTFGAPIASGATYAVTVKTQPTGHSQTCTVSGGNGTVGAGNVASITVNCAPNKLTVGGNTSGYVGTGLVLQNNAGDDLAVASNGTFAFPTAVDSGQPYAVTVKTQPPSPSQTCTVANGSGVASDGDVTNVAVTCATNAFSVGGAVSNLVGTLVLTNNGGDDKTVTTNGNFSFATAVASGATYAIAVKTQPTGMDCQVSNGSGTVADAKVTNVSVTCSAPASCLAIKQANAGATSGSYVIDPDGAGNKGPLSVYCDMTTDGGGYTYYQVTSGISTFKRTEANSCQALGLEIAVPRTAAHLSAMFAWTANDMSFFQTVPGIYGKYNNVNYSGCAMNSQSSCANVVSDWAAIDGSNWFASSRTSITEPNGDYTPDCWLGNGGTIDSSGYTWLNDGNCGYQTGTKYICSDNAKK